MIEEQIKALILTMFEIIKEEDNNEDDFLYFKEKLNCKHMRKHWDYSLLYRVAVSYCKYDYSDLIIQTTDYDINKDSESIVDDIKANIISCSCCGIRDTETSRYLFDGFYPTEDSLLEIIDFYKGLVPDSYDNEIFNQFKHMNKLLKIKNIKNNLHRK